jgi:pyruvate/2-oxoglutarate dehydrogenase complex dihydrolipoamide acyltransferase (E2) component
LATTVVVPRVGVKVTEVTIITWHVDDGAPVDVGAPLLTIETDKVEVELEAPASGTLRQLAAEGDVHPVGAVIGEIS